MAKKLVIQNPANIYMNIATTPAVPAAAVSPSKKKPHGVQLLVDVDLYGRAMIHARETGCSFTKLVTDLITQALADAPAPAPQNPATRFMSIAADKRFVAPPRMDIRRKRVHLNMDPELFERARTYAAAREMSVNKMIHDLLETICP